MIQSLTFETTRAGERGAVGRELWRDHWRDHRRDDRRCHGRRATDRMPTDRIHHGQVIGGYRLDCSGRRESIQRIFGHRRSPVAGVAARGGVERAEIGGPAVDGEISRRRGGEIPRPGRRVVQQVEQRVAVPAAMMSLVKPVGAAATLASQWILMWMLIVNAVGDGGNVGKAIGAGGIGGGDGIRGI
jgi:hypothetical protein